MYLPILNRFGRSCLNSGPKLFGKRQPALIPGQRVVAEIESVATLNAAVAAGLGATILPESAARATAKSIQGQLCSIAEPAIEVPLALCASDHLPLSEPAQAVKDIILELVEQQTFDFGPGEPGAEA